MGYALASDCNGTDHHHMVATKWQQVPDLKLFRLGQHISGSIPSVVHCSQLPQQASSI